MNTSIPKILVSAELETLEVDDGSELIENEIYIDKKDVGLFSVNISDSDLENVLSDFTNASDIDKKLSELQCPFTWQLPREGIMPLAMVSIFTSVAKEIKDGEEFKMRNFTYDILTVYELYNAGKLDKAYKMLTSLMSNLEDLYGSCEEEFFISMKKPLQHIVLSCKAHLLKAYFSDKLPSQAELYTRKMLKILCTIHPYTEMNKVELAGIYGFKAQAFSEYGYNGLTQALQYAKKALELDPKQSEWYYLAGKIMGSIRRQVNWNDYVKEEELNCLEKAIELNEKPSYLVFLAVAYIECTKTIHRNLQVDEEMSKKLHEMNSRAKQLFMRCIELSPDCPVLSMRCANGMLKMPKHFADKDVVEKCIKVALNKSPDDPMVHHAAGMCAERLEYDIDKALHHYEIASEFVYGALADFIRLKYTYEKEYDLIGGLENMLESYMSLPSVHKTLSYIASYYLFLKRDLIKALEYYERIMDEDCDSPAITASKPLFLNMKTPVNMYHILWTEVNLELQKNELSNKEINTLKGFLSKLNEIDPEILKKCANKPSRIQQIIDDSVMLTEKYKAIIQKKREQNLKSGGNTRGNVRKISTSRGKGRGRGQATSGRRQSDSGLISMGSWRNSGSLESGRRGSNVEATRKANTELHRSASVVEPSRKANIEPYRRASIAEPSRKVNTESYRRASITGSWREKENDTEAEQPKEVDHPESGDSIGKLPPKKQDSLKSGYNTRGFARLRIYSNEFRRNDQDNFNNGLNVKDYGRPRTHSNEFRRNEQANTNSLNIKDYGRPRTYSNEFKRSEQTNTNSLNVKDYGSPRTHSNEFKMNEPENSNNSLGITDFGRPRTYSNECKRIEQDNAINDFSVKDYGRPRTYSNDFKQFKKSRVMQTIRDPYGPFEGGVQKSFERKRVPDIKWMKQ